MARLPLMTHGGCERCQYMVRIGTEHGVIGMPAVPDRIEPVTALQIRSILELALGNEAAVESVSPLGGGSINATFQVDLRDRASVVLRVAPSDAAAARGPGWLTSWGLRREAAVIALATPALGDLLPATVATGFDRAVIDRDWVIQERVPGVPLSTVDAGLLPDERDALWIELGQLTRRLHETAGGWFGPPLAGPRFERLSDLLDHDAHGLVDDAARFGLPQAPFERLRGRIGALADVLDDTPGPRLVHSDLARSHVFVERGGDETFHISGIIDLEFGRFADPQLERLITSFQWGNAPLEMKETFFAGYGRRFDAPEDRLRLGVYVALALAWSATILAFHGQRANWANLSDVIAQMETALQD